MTCGKSVIVGNAYNRPLSQGQRRVLTPSARVGNWVKKQGSLLFVDDAKRLMISRLNRLTISLNNAGCKRHSEWSMGALLSQSAHILSAPAICSALMDLKLRSAQRQRSLASMSIFDCVSPCLFTWALTAILSVMRSTWCSLNNA